MPSTLTANPCSIKYVLVTGRRSEFENDQSRRRLIKTQERDDFKIISYDSLLEAMRFKRPLYLAIRHNEYYAVSGSEYAGDNLFAYLPKHKIKISEHLHDVLYKSKNRWFVFNASTGKHYLEEVLPFLDIFPNKSA